MNIEVMYLDKSFNINILGQELSVLSDSGDEHAASVVKYVNDKIKEAGNTSANANTLNVAILAALKLQMSILNLRE
jgi:cell division protein ZapA (FtsZ GTPase activity inhibitor)